MTRNQRVNLELIKSLAKERGLSIAALGRAIGLKDRQYIYARLSGRYSLTADELFNIASVLGVKTDQLRR